MATQSRTQKDKVERVMHEFKEGELEANGGRRVTNPKQAIAIALREAGVSNRGKSRKGGSKGADDESRASLYAEAKRRDIAGRSKMSKDELKRALHGA